MGAGPCGWYLQAPGCLLTQLLTRKVFLESPWLDFLCSSVRASHTHRAQALKGMWLL